MFRVALASVLGNKIRLALTALAIVLGVAFVAGSFVLTDSIDVAFGNLLDEANAGVDVYVNPESVLDQDVTTAVPGGGPGLSDELVDEVAGVDGVAAVVGTVEGTAQVIGPDGEPVGGLGPPTLAFSWAGPTEGGPLTQQEGRPASGPEEITLDGGTAETTGYGVGDTVPVLLSDGVRDFEVVGITGFGAEDNLLGATIVTFDLSTAQEVLDREGEVTSISVSAEAGVAPDELRDRIDEAVGGAPVEVVTADDQQAAEQAEITQGLSFLNIALLAFAGIALFVGIFLIVNTFSIIVAQRTREFALLRAVGASARQVQATVVVEALVVGVVAGFLGLLAGLGLSELMRAIFDAIGFGFPDGGLVIESRTIVVSMVLGVVVTAIASIAPARRASRISPMEALREGSGGDDDRVGVRRTIGGLLLGGLGAAAIVVGLTLDVPQPAALVGAGAAGTFIGVALLAPHLARPVANVVGAMPARVGVSGRLGRNNAGGNPKRTASTASALMIGVALVSFVSIFAASATASVNELFAAQLGSDYTITPQGFGPAGVPPGVVPALDELDETGAVMGLRTAPFEREQGASESLTAIDPAVVEELVSIAPADGALDALAEGDGVLVHDEFADEQGLAVGDTVDARFVSAETSLQVVGTFANREVIGSPWVTDQATFDELAGDGIQYLVLADGADGVAPADARAAIDSALETRFPNVQVQDQAELADSLRAQVDGLLNVIVGLLGLALVIALIGIVNTLALSVFERTREIGLLRAVGMTRRQVRSMVRWESVIVAVFGAVLGVVVGSVFGWALVRAAADQGLDVLEFPAGRLVTYVVVAGLAGVLAAVFPARRAARLDVLEAITTE
jgi:putative ABC transport system permease protein